MRRKKHDQGASRPTATPLSQTEAQAAAATRRLAENRSLEELLDAHLSPGKKVCKLADIARALNQPALYARLPSPEPARPRSGLGQPKSPQQPAGVASSGILHLESEFARRADRPVRLNLLIVGRKGTGKSCFSEALLRYKFGEEACLRADAQQSDLGPVSRTSGRQVLDGVDLHVEVTDTPGYSHASIQQWYALVKHLLLSRFDRRPPEADEELIHLTLFLFDQPELSAEEGACLKRLGRYTNLIPIHTKGDCLSTEEVRSNKARFNERSRLYQVAWFNVKEVLRSHPRKQTQLLSSRLGPCPPFLVISPNHVVAQASRKVYSRKSSWGECDVANPDYTDFLLFYNLLIGYLYFPLKERTNVLKELFQDKRLAGLALQTHERRKVDSSTAIDFGLGVAVGVGILGALTLFAKGWN